MRPESELPAEAPIPEVPWFPVETTLPKGTPIPVLVLFGPTASGKTAVLERLFAGSGARYPAEVVSADSMQVYRGMDVGTAKPSTELLSRLPHHLIDIRNPDEPFSVGDFVRLADEACRRIAAAGRLPVVSGGTGFYLKNFLLGLSAAPPSDPAVREALGAELAQRGREALREELYAVDPASAERIHAHDEYRILRALEVFRVSGRPLSSFAAAAPAADRPAYRFLVLGIRRPRDELYRLIDERTAAMFRGGLPEEVARLVAAGYGPDDPGLRAIGYREFFAEDGSVSRDLAAVEGLVARNSRRYAKRQITFFSCLRGVAWIDAAADPEEARRAVEAEIERFGIRGTRAGGAAESAGP